MSQPLIIGHRGASAVAPENTIAAFTAAIAAGADGIEFDVRLTRDVIPVVIHDETLYRTGGVQRRVGDLSLSELSEIDVGSWFGRAEFVNQRVPTLAQLFESFQANNLILYLEMKGQQSHLAEACCRLVEEYRLKERVVFECFEHSTLQKIKEIDPALKTAALFQPPAAFILKRARAARADEIALHYRLAKTRLLHKAKPAGFKVVVWTVDDPAWIEHARATDIHALITNDPSALLAARNAI